jgi:hypothetical protein
MTCECNKKCKEPCGCAEPVFSVEAMPDDPTVLRFNVNGKSVWYDFESAVKAGETCTTLNVDAVNRTLNYHGECGDQTISAREIGTILHLGDLGDVDENSITDNGILNYRKTGDCPEGCEGKADGWTSSNPIEIGDSSLEYILGSDSDGKMMSLMPPTDTTSFSYLAWAAQNKAKWVVPTKVVSAPNDGTYKYPLYLDPNSGEIVAVKEAI